MPPTDVRHRRSSTKGRPRRTAASSRALSFRPLPLAKPPRAGWRLARRLAPATERRGAGRCLRRALHTQGRDLAAQLLSSPAGDRSTPSQTKARFRGRFLEPATTKVRGPTSATSTPTSDFGGTLRRSEWRWRSSSGSEAGKRSRMRGGGGRGGGDDESSKNGLGAVKTGRTDRPAAPKRRATAQQRPSGRPGATNPASARIDRHVLGLHRQELHARTIHRQAAEERTRPHQRLLRSPARGESEVQDDPPADARGAARPAADPRKGEDRPSEARSRRSPWKTFSGAAPHRRRRARRGSKGARCGARAAGDLRARHRCV